MLWLVAGDVRPFDCPVILPAANAKIAYDKNNNPYYICMIIYTEGVCK